MAYGIGIPMLFGSPMGILKEILTRKFRNIICINIVGGPETIGIYQES
jgi:hypothetical protein